MKFPPLVFKTKYVLIFHNIRDTILLPAIQFLSYSLFFSFISFMAACLPLSKEVREKYMRSEVVLNETHYLRL